MALDNSDLKSIIDAIMNERKSNSIFNAGQDTGIKDLRDANERNSDAQLQTLKDILNNDRQNTKDFVKAVNKAFKDSNIPTEIKSFKDALLAQDQAQAMSHVASELKKIKAKEYSTYEEAQSRLNELNDELGKVGMSLEDFGDAAAKVTEVEGKIFKDEKGFRIEGAKNAKLLDDQADITVDALDKASTAYNKHTERVKISKQAIYKFGGAVKAVAKQFLKFAEQEQRFQQATATADAGWIEGITSLGISQLEYAKILKDTRIEQLAMATSGINFKESLKSSADSLENLTPDLQTAAIVANKFHKNMALAGVSQDKLGDAVQQQTAMYKDNFRAMGITADEFANLTTELINTQGMRNELLTLQESERKQYVLSIQRRQAEYLTMGYSIERAKELQSTFQAINKLSPKSRMKKAAQERTMLSAMGMGAEGAELFDLQIRMRTMSAEKRAAAELKITKIREKAAKKYGQLSGSGAGLGQSMVFQNMAERTGFDAVAEKFETESMLGRKIATDQLDTLNEINTNISSLLKWKSMFDAASNSAVGSVANSALQLGGLYLGGKMINSGVSKVAGMFGGGGGAAAAAADAASQASKVSAANSAFKATGAVTSASEGALKKGMTKAAAKSALKAIPGIGVMVGLGLAGHRMMEGDYLGAAMELGAGAVGLLPGAGTAASLALSGGLVAYDLAKNNDADDGIPTSSSDETADGKKTISIIMEELSITMKSLNEYIRVNGDTNTDQLVTIKKATNEMNINRHYLAANSARSAQ